MTLALLGVGAALVVAGELLRREVRAHDGFVRWVTGEKEDEMVTKRKDRWIAAGCIAVVGLIFFAALSCTPVQPTPIPDGGTTVTTNVNVNTGPANGGTGGTGAPGSCNPVASLGVSLLGTGGVRTATIRVGQTITLDTTPKDANNQIRPDSCNAATPVLWRLNPTAGICSLNNETTYTPTLTGVGVGRCEAFSQIGSVTASIPVVVNVTCSTCS